LNVAVEIAARDNASGPIRGVGDALEGLGTRAGGVTGALSTLAGVGLAGVAAGAVGVIGGLGGAVAAATGFESRMSSVGAVSGATADQMKQLSGLALQLGKDTAFSASEAAAGIEELVKGGLTIPDIMNGAAKATLNLAAAGGVSLPEAATIAANALAQFNLRGEDMAHVSDLIAGAANASALDVGQFSYSLQAAGAVAATVGFSFDDLAQAIAVMGKAGITGSDAGTSLKTMMLNLVPSTDKATAKMRELGIIGLDTNRAMEILRNYGIDATGLSLEQMDTQLVKAVTGWNGVGAMTKEQSKTWKEAQTELGAYSNRFFDATGKVKSMAEVSQILQDATRGLTQEQKLSTLNLLFGSDAIRAAAVLTKEGAAGFEGMASAMGKVTAEAVGAAKLDNVRGAIEQLKGSLETAGIVLGTAFLPLIRRTIDAATGIVNGLIPAFEAIGPRLAAFAQEWGERIGTLLSGLFGGEGLAASVNAAFGDLISPQTTAALDALAGVVGRVRDALGGLVATVQQGGLAGLWAQVASAMADFAPTGERVQGALKAVGDAVRSLVPRPLVDFVQGLADAASGAAAGQGPLTILAGVVNAVSGALAGAVRWLNENKMAASALAGAATALGAAWAISSTITAATTAFAAMRLALLAAMGATEGMTVAQAALNLVMRANPLMLIVTALGAVAGALVFAYQTNETFRAGVDAAWAAIKNVVSAVVPVLIAQTEAWIGSVVEGAAAVGTFVLNVARAYNEMSARVQAVYAAMIRATVGAFQSITGAVAAGMQAVTGAVSGGWNAANEATGGALGAMQGVVSSSFSLMTGDVSGAMGIIVPLVQTSWASVKSAIDEATGGALTTVINFGKELLEEIGKQAASVLIHARSIGSAIIDGIKAGIEGGWAGIVSWFVGQIKTLVPAAMAALIARSPSRAFMKVGETIPQGLAVGIASGMSTAVAAVKRVITAVYDAATGVALTGGGRNPGARLVETVAAGIESNIGAVLTAIMRLSQEGQAAMRGLAESIGGQFTGWIGDVVRKRTELLWRFNFEAFKRGEGTKVLAPLEDATRDFIAKTETAVARATSKLHSLTLQYEADVLDARRDAADAALKITADAEKKLADLQADDALKREIAHRRALFAEMQRAQKEHYDRLIGQREDALRREEDLSRIAFQRQLKLGRVGVDPSAGVTAAQSALDAAAEEARIAFQLERGLIDAARAEQARTDLRNRLDEAEYVAKATRDLALRLQREQIEAEAAQARQALDDRRQEEMFVASETGRLRLEIARMRAEEEKRIAVDAFGFEYQLEQEEYLRRVKQIQDERDERLKAVTAELAEREKALRESYEAERATIIANLAQQLEDFKTEYLDKVKDAFRQAGVDLVDFMDLINTDLSRRVDVQHQRIMSMVAALAALRADPGPVPAFTYAPGLAPALPDTTRFGMAPATAAPAAPPVVQKQYIANVTTLTANVDEQEVGRVLQRLTMVSGS
jgi:phage-related protein